MLIFAEPMIYIIKLINKRFTLPEKNKEKIYKRY